MNFKKHLINKNTTKAIGMMSLVVASALFTACSGGEEAQNTAQNQEVQKKLLTINEVEEGKYVIVDELPYHENKAIVKDLNGTETIYNEAELKKFAEEEMAKVENNTSNLTSPNAQVQDSGLSFGEVLLAGAAGAILGSVIGNMLSSNSNYQANQQRYNQSPAAQQRFSSMGSSSTAPKTAPTKESFFNKSGSTATTGTTGTTSSSTSSSSSSTSKSSFFGGSSSSSSSSSFGG